MDWIDELFEDANDEGVVDIDWKTQSLLIHLLEKSTLKQDSELKAKMARGKFSREELDVLFRKLEAHLEPLSTNPSQTEISKFIKKICQL